MEISPLPDDQEAAAIMAGMEALWPRPAAAVEAPDQPGRWRFSNRWWDGPLPRVRQRP